MGCDYWRNVRYGALSGPQKAPIQFRAFRQNGHSAAGALAAECTECLCPNSHYGGESHGCGAVLRCLCQIAPRVPELWGPLGACAGQIASTSGMAVFLQACGFKGRREPLCFDVGLQFEYGSWPFGFGAASSSAPYKGRQPSRCAQRRTAAASLALDAGDQEITHSTPEIPGLAEPHSPTVG
jgi:hypothetical protein